MTPLTLADPRLCDACEHRSMMHKTYCQHPSGRYAVELTPHKTPVPSHCPFKGWTEDDIAIHLVTQTLIGQAL